MLLESRSIRPLLALPWHGLLLVLGVVLIIAAGAWRMAPPPDAPASPAPAPIDATLAARFGLHETLLLGYRPHGDDLLSEEALARIGALRAALSVLPDVHRVTTLLDVPLLFSPPVRPVDLGGDLLRVADAGVDIELARDEFRTSPLYRRLLLASDGQQTVLRIALEHGARGAETMALLRRAIEPFEADAELQLVAPHAVPMTADLQRAALPLRHLIALFALAVLIGTVLYRGIAWALIAPGAAAVSGLLLCGVLGWTGRPFDTPALCGIAVAMICAAAMALRLVAVCRNDAHGAAAERVTRALQQSLPGLGRGVLVVTAGFVMLAAVGDRPAIGLVPAIAVLLAGATALLLVPSMLRIATDVATLVPAPMRLPAGAAVLLLGAIGLGQLAFAGGPLARHQVSDAAASAHASIADAFDGIEPFHVVLRDDADRRGAGSANAWFSVAGMQRVRAAHEVLAGLDDVAWVRSLALVQQTMERLYAHPPNDHELAALWSRLPRTRRERMIDSWLSPDEPETLLVAGWRSGAAPGVMRHERALQIERELMQRLQLAPGQVEVHGGSDAAVAVRGSMRVALLLALGVAAAVFLLCECLVWRRTWLSAVRMLLLPLLAAIAAFVTAQSLLPAGSVVFALLAFASLLLADPSPGKRGSRTG